MSSSARCSTWKPSVRIACASPDYLKRRGVPGSPAQLGEHDGLDWEGLAPPFAWRFEHDGQITKRPIRALTLSALAPRAGERLWDLGAGSGSISVEWCLATPTTTAICVEAKPNRTPNIRANAETYGLSDRMSVVEAPALAAIESLPTPDAVFIGGSGGGGGLGGSNFSGSGGGGGGNHRFTARDGRLHSAELRLRQHHRWHGSKSGCRCGFWWFGSGQHC